MTNTASFNKKYLQSIHGDYPRCIVTGIHGNRHSGNLPVELSVCDFDHILGRNKDDYLYSSVYNCCPILRICHQHFGNMGNKWFRMFQLERVREIVQTAIREGRYEETDTDVAFLHEVIPEWQAKEFPIE